MLWSGSWSLCQNAVEAVLRGAPITPIGSEVAEQNNGPPLKAYDIRHVSKEENHSNELHKVRTRPRFKKSGSKAAKTAPVPEPGHDEVNGSPSRESHESSLSHQSLAAPVVEADSLVSAAAELEFGLDNEPVNEDGEIELELTLGFEPVHKKSSGSPAVRCGNDLDLGLDCLARVE